MVSYNTDLNITKTILFTHTQNKYVWKNYFILQFYLSKQIASTGYILYIYCHWPKNSFFSRTPSNCYRDSRGRDRIVVGCTTMPMQSVPITTDVASSNLDQGKMYNIMW
jgi:hypothetical protein